MKIFAKGRYGLRALVIIPECSLKKTSTHISRGLMLSICHLKMFFKGMFNKTVKLADVAVAFEELSKTTESVRYALVP